MRECQIKEFTDKTNGLKLREMEMDSVGREGLLLQ